MKHRIHLSVLCASLLGWVGLSAADPSLASTGTKYAVDIPSEDLGDALQAFALASGHKLLYSSDLVFGKRSAAIKGQFTTEEGVRRLIANTNLKSEVTPNGLVMIRAANVGDPPNDVSQPSTNDQAAKEAGKKSSQDFRVAQVDQGAAGPPPVKNSKASESDSKKDQLEEVVVTGSRIPQKVANAAQEVKTYTKEQISQSGQTTISDFLNTLPDVSVAYTEAGSQSLVGATTVQLHGLPVGSTLVLLNGRRVESSGSVGGTFFDLSSIPVSAVERIEVISEGSSAIYGSDALAGVVNIILKSKVDGFEVSSKYGGAAGGFHDITSSLAWGRQWGAGSMSVIASYETRDALLASARSITGDEDYRRFGGIDARSTNCAAANIFSINGSPLPGLGSATYASVPANFSGKPTLQEFSDTAGILSECNNNGYNALIPTTHRTGILAQGSYDASESVRLFTELIFSQVDNSQNGIPATLYGVPQAGYSFFTISAANPFNPFGVPVGVSGLLVDTPNGQTLDTHFYRALVGAQGALADYWRWELAVWDSQDRSALSYPSLSDYLGLGTPTQNALNSANPATALNPFVDGPYASQAVLSSLFAEAEQTFRSKADVVNAFAHGSVPGLPAGRVQTAFGFEYERDEVAQGNNNNGALGLPTNYHRDHGAVFGELKIPLLGRGSRAANDDELLTANLAGRDDRYNDFGTKFTPQFSVELRPINSLLLRGTYGKAFQAPNLTYLHSPLVNNTGVNGVTITDPKTGLTYMVPWIIGGNPSLAPLIGSSTTFSVVYSSLGIPGLHLSLTNWRVSVDDSVLSPSAQLLVDNEDLFPGRITRAPSQNGQPGPITQLNLTYLNFGKTEVAGLDYRADYSLQTGIGVWSPSIAATQTYHYESALTPGSLPTQRVSAANDDGNWAPRWKGTVALGWTAGPVTATVDGRYIGRYQDYDTSSVIGNFWLSDMNIRYALANAAHNPNDWRSGLYAELGGVNVFNKLPQYSNFQSGTNGYDPTQADIRGRFLYLQIGGKF